MEAVDFGWNGLKKNVLFFVKLMIIVTVLYTLPSVVWGIFFESFIPNGVPSTEGFLLMAIPPAIASMIIYLTVELGLLKIALSFRDNKTPEFKDLFRGYPLLTNYLAASIIYGLMIGVGPILLSAGVFILGPNVSPVLIIPVALIFFVLAVYLSLKYQFYGYLIVDKGMGPIEALQKSGKLTKGALENLFEFWFELYCGIAVIAIILGVLIAIPVGVLVAFMSKDLFLLPNFAATANLFSVFIKLLVIVPITKLATAYIYRALEARSAASASSSILEQGAEELVDDEE
jgi:uncharacterized membrane protein